MLSWFLSGWYFRASFLGNRVGERGKRACRGEVVLVPSDGTQCIMFVVRCWCALGNVPSVQASATIIVSVFSKTIDCVSNVQTFLLLNLDTVQSTVNCRFVTSVRFGLVHLTPILKRQFHRNDQGSTASRGNHNYCHVCRALEAGTMYHLTKGVLSLWNRESGYRLELFADIARCCT